MIERARSYGRRFQAAAFTIACAGMVCLTLLPAQLSRGDDNAPLDPRERLGGDALAAAFEPVLGPAYRATVRVMRDGQPVALGTVVESDGLIVTKASEVQGSRSLGVELFDGRAMRARVVALDDENDLALLRVAQTGLTVAPWIEPGSPPGLGRWVAAVTPAEPQAPHEANWLRAIGSRWLSGEGSNEERTSRGRDGTDAGVVAATARVGVVSAAQRTIPREGGVIGVRFEGENASGEDGVWIGAVQPGSGAAEAGLQPGDLITHVNSQPTPTGALLAQAIRSHPPGHTLRVTYRRQGQVAEAEVTLGRQEEVFPEIGFGHHRALNGETSRRSDGFAAVLQHHIPIRPAHCGGPLIDLDGRVVGINIARVNRSESYALPADLVRGRVEWMLASSQR